MNETTTQSPRILIVDDQEIMRIGLVLALEKECGLGVIGQAEDGAEAIEKATELNPDVILMDIGLKTTNGIDAVREIKALHPHIRVIMFTSHESDNEVLAALTAGAEGYCLKTVSTKALHTAIESVVNGGIWLDPAIATKVLKLTGPAPTVSSGTVSPINSGSHQAARRDSKFSLSTREHEVLHLVSEGCSNAVIAEKLFISPETVKTHVRHLMEKLAVADRTQAAVKALREGLV